MLITLLSSDAQESSSTKSESVKWGYQRQFENGKVYISNLYGYKQTNGVISIIEEEAKVVRLVYKMYLSGSSEIEIEKELKQRGIKTRKGKDFSRSVIHRMLQNEKYAGDSISGKTYSKSFIDQKRLENKGQRPMYYVENSHVGIISKEVFKEVQVERSRRAAKEKIEDYEERIQKSEDRKAERKNSKGRYSSTNALSHHIICADCGNFYRRAVWRKRNGDKQPVWRCSTKLDIGKEACVGSSTLKESKLFDELRIIINEMIESRDDLRMEIAEKVSEFINPNDIMNAKKKLEKELDEVAQEISKELNHGMLLVSRGVQDESQLKEHLDQHYKIKRKLNEELEITNQKLQEIREIKQEKTLKVLNQIDSSVSYLTQDEIALFIEEIVVYKKQLLVKTVLGTTYEIDISKVK